MALRAVYDHPKFRRLVRVLGSEYRAMGALELVWHFTAKFAPQGNIGKYSDSEIETWIGWDGEEGGAVAALVKCGWLDVDPDHRLSVHDWHEWADSEVHAILAKRVLRFLNGDAPRLDKTRFGGPARARIHAQYRGQDGGHDGDTVPPESTDDDENDTSRGKKSPPGQSQSQSQSRGRERARARSGGLSEGKKPNPPERKAQDLTPLPPEGDADADMTAGEALWVPFSKVPCFSMGSTEAQIAGLQEVAQTYKGMGMEKLLALAKRCARHYAPNKVVLGNIKSASNALETWIATETRIEQRDAQSSGDGFQHV